MGDLNEKEVYTDLKMVPGSTVKDDSGRDVLFKKVTSFANLPITGEGDGDTYLVLDEDTIYSWDVESLSWVVPAANSKGFTNGCRLEYVSTTTISVEAGIIGIKQKTYEKNVDLTVGWTSVDTGTTRKASTWYFMYLEADPANPKTYRAFISEQAPNKDQFGNTIASDGNKAKYHPTRTARFVGSFKTNSSQNIMQFKVNGNYVAYIGIVTYNYFLQNGNAGSKTAVNCRTFVPVTSSLCQVYYEMQAGTNIRYIGDSAQWYWKGAGSSGSLMLPVTNNSVYYQCSGSQTVSLGIHGYYEDI